MDEAVFSHTTLTDSFEKASIKREWEKLSLWPEFLGSPWQAIT